MCILFYNVQHGATREGMKILRTGDAQQGTSLSGIQIFPVKYDH